ncbi:MAG: glutamate-1-semialdehyde 2,1-aminomutase, partial [Burkholderiales bacterium]|nr:glutamate-1-semialdehyde 2,1-aminomutase [Burkholderiales bacterium]
AVLNGCSFGTPTEIETKLANTICSIMQNIEKIRFVNSGTEAVMSAIRLARGFTNRPYIVKFNGCYHGHTDSMLVSAGSGAMTFNNPSSNGVLKDAVDNTIVLEYNDAEGLEEAFKLYGDKIAGIIFEPYVGNMNLVCPITDFIENLREIPKKYGSLLICDEVMTGFRVDLRGAQHLLGIKPDITILGKVIGGGMPIAGFGGRTDIMDNLSPTGSVYQAGTLSGNPIAVSCGLANLEIVQHAGFYEQISNSAKKLVNGLIDIATKNGVKLSGTSIGGMFGLHFQDKLPNNLAQVKSANQVVFNKFFHLMLENGVFFAPSMFEAGFVNIAHSDEVIEQTIDIAKRVFAQLS